MREPKNQMLGTMEPPMQLSVKMVKKGKKSQCLESILSDGMC